MNVMKIFGYSQEHPDCLQDMREISFQITPSDLLRVAAFLRDAAHAIEKNPNIDHIHLRDELSGWSETLPDIVVAPFSPCSK